MPSLSGNRWRRIAPDIHSWSSILGRLGLRRIVHFAAYPVQPGDLVFFGSSSSSIDHVGNRGLGNWDIG